MVRNKVNLGRHREVSARKSSLKNREKDQIDHFRGLNSWNGERYQRITEAL
jgi:hypothetical protein